MDDLLRELEFRPRPTSERPLLGLTVLVVEDSRFASEALRLMCLRSGARIRRADCLASAHRHLTVYRPTVALVDLGLPDGSGLGLVAEMDRATPRVPVILATTGADRAEAEAAALEAGANGFLAKPVDSMAVFQAAILRHLPDDLRPRGPRATGHDQVEPDALAYREDLNHAIALLDEDSPPIAYLKPFLIGVARAAHDEGLEASARRLGLHPARRERISLRALLSDRISRMAAV